LEYIFLYASRPPRAHSRALRSYRDSGDGGACSVFEKPKVRENATANMKRKYWWIFGAIQLLGVLALFDSLLIQAPLFGIIVLVADTRNSGFGGIEWPPRF
jgi:hypothetical protein